MNLELEDKEQRFRDALGRAVQMISHAAASLDHAVDGLADYEDLAEETVLLASAANLVQHLWRQCDLLLEAVDAVASGARPAQPAQPEAHAAIFQVS